MTARRWAAYVWAAPTSALGLVAIALSAPSVRTVSGVIEAHGPGVARLLDLLSPRLPVQAMTLGHVVIARDAAALEHTRAHERVHVRQAECWGPLFVPAYVAASAVVWARGGDTYADNRFERAAWAVAPVIEAPETRRGASASVATI